MGLVLGLLLHKVPDFVRRSVPKSELCVDRAERGHGVRQGTQVHAIQVMGHAPRFVDGGEGPVDEGVYKEGQGRGD